MPGMRFRARKQTRGRRAGGMRFRARRRTRRRTFRGRRKGGGRATARLAARLRKYMTELKFLTVDRGTETVPLAITLGLDGLAGMSMALGDGAGVREGDKVRWGRYTWDLNVFGGVHAGSQYRRANYNFWEVIVWWKGNTATFLADVSIIFRTNTDNYDRIFDGFNPNARRNFDVLYSRKYLLRPESSSGVAFQPSADTGISQGWNGIGGQYLHHSKGSISLKGRTSRYAGVGNSNPVDGIMVHLIMEGDRGGWLITKTGYWGRARYSYWDD